MVLAALDHSHREPRLKEQLLYAITYHVRTCQDEAPSTVEPEIDPDSDVDT